ncbi:glycosyltransferase [Micromonospora sp. KC721]|uniref:glycosyltransferase n=1 Tax=Micromonospora sp. KC721 TaxID=2530380 RepID=UPI00104EC2C6|nr:glycosyltransferase [Micromonospora sp. KC721]
MLQLTLEPLVPQDLDPDDYEVLVVDDGSSDDTSDVVKKYMDQMNLRYFLQEDEGYRPPGPGRSAAAGSRSTASPAGPSRRRGAPWRPASRTSARRSRRAATVAGQPLPASRTKRSICSGDSPDSGPHTPGNPDRRR